MLSTMLSVAERLAVLSQAKCTDELTELAKTIESDTEPLEGEVRESIWSNTRKEERLLARISRCMDQGDIQGATQTMLKLSTHAVHRHARVREQFFTVGRGAGGVDKHNPAEECCTNVETALDAVIPDIKKYFSDLASADADQQAIDYVEQCRQAAHEQREARIEQKNRKARALKSKRRKEKEMVQLAQEYNQQAQLEEEEEAREEYIRLQRARADKYKEAERRAAADRRRKFEKRRQEMEQERDSVNSGARSAPLIRDAGPSHSGPKIATSSGARGRGERSPKESTPLGASPSLLPPFKPRNSKARMLRSEAPYICAVHALDAPQPLAGLEEEPEDRPLSPVRLMSNTRVEKTDNIAAEMERRAKEQAKFVASEKRRMARLANAPLPMPKGLPSDPISGEVMTSKSIMDTSPMFQDEQRDERAPLRTLLSIITAGNRTMSGAGEGERDEIDTRALAEITGMVESHVTTLLAQYVGEMKRASRPMKVEQFRRFMRKHHFSDTMIINRLFEVFDVCKAGVITFAELLVGLCFFILHKKWETTRQNPLFLDYAARFLDIDGQEKVSKFKLYTVCASVFGKDFAGDLSDAMWEVLSGTGQSISYSEFQRALCEMPDMREIVHELMVLQSLDPESEEFAQVEEDIRAATQEWREWKAVGRLHGLDCLVDEFVLASDKKAQEKIAARADEIANVRKGRDGLAASFYVKTLRHLILEKDGSKYVREELKGISDTLASDDTKQQNAFDAKGRGEEAEDEHMLEGDTRLRLEMGVAILEAFRYRLQR